jgi:hypothetical protein
MMDLWINGEFRRIKLADLRKQAASIGVNIVAVRDDHGWGYWLENTGWDDDNFCSSHGEIEQKLKQIKNGLKVSG